MKTFKDLPCEIKRHFRGIDPKTFPEVVKITHMDEKQMEWQDRWRNTLLDVSENIQLEALCFTPPHDLNLDDAKVIMPMGEDAIFVSLQHYLDPDYGYNNFTTHQSFSELKRNYFSMDSNSEVRITLTVKQVETIERVVEVFNILKTTNPSLEKLILSDELRNSIPEILSIIAELKRNERWPSKI